MAASGFTPIQLYRTATAAAAPTAGNLADGELAINTLDEKLYFKNSAGTVKLLASTAGATGDVAGPASATDNALAAFDGTTGKLIKNANLTANNVLLGNGTGAPQVVAPGTAGNVLTSNGTTWTSTAGSGGDVTLNGTQTLTNKTIAFGSNTLTDVAGTTATQTLTNKTLTSPVITQNIQVISTNTTAVRSRTYVFTATLTLDLPASPAAGDMVMFSNRSATATPVIGRNGQNIMSLAENMTVDNVNYFGTLVYADATRGWIFQ